MPLRNTATHYGCLMRFFHSLVFVLVTIQLLLGVFLNDIPKSAKGMVMTFHKSLGLTILLVAILFILTRFFNRKPAWPQGMRAWEKGMAHLVHVCLYISILILPLSGWVMSTAAGKAPNYFWLGQLAMPGIPFNKALAGAAAQVHYITVWVLISLIALHIIGALKHHYIDKNNILSRMWTKKC